MASKSIDGIVSEHWPDNDFLGAVEDEWCLHHVHYVPGLVMPKTRRAITGKYAPKEGMPIPTSSALEWIKDKHPVLGLRLYDYIVELYGDDYIQGKIR